MKKKILKVIKRVLFYTFIAFSVGIGVELYRVFLGYYPGVNINELFIARIGVDAFFFFGVCAGILISLPIALVAFEIYYRFSSAYVHFLTENGMVHLSDKAMENFILDVVSEIAGVKSLEVSVDIFKENSIGIHLWVDTDEKNDFVRFSERIQQRVLQDLEFSFGIKKTRFFSVYVESTDIQASSTGYKVDYK
jgi:hypothetical protein